MKRTIAQALRALLRRLSRPVRRDSGRRGVVIHTYRGYGSQREIFLMGRVLRQPRFDFLRDNAYDPTLVDFLRRVFRRGVRDAEVRAALGGVEARATTDADGYFQIRLAAEDAAQPSAQPAGLPPGLPGDGWQQVEIVLDAPAEAAGATARAEVYLRPAASRCIVVSDIDDTVVQTGVANKLRMFWNLFFEDVESRVAYPGVAEFYRQLHDGASGDQGNPMLYVSRGPWAIYEVLELFFQRHRVPVGPILFLREWGMTLQRPLPPPAKDHKLSLIRDMLDVYPDAPFVLIGDSGQHDPEIYTQVVREHPERVRAIYIRSVHRRTGRDAAIADLAEEVATAGAELLLADDTVEMARHALRHGLVAETAPALVRGERSHDERVAEE